MPLELRESMTPFQFGESDRRALGLLHAPDTPRTPATGVLICNPFGQEAVRSHRLFRVLADRLARNGRHVLRFDYHGTGDSAGQDSDGELEGWQRDIALAHDELLSRSRCARVIWLGARLGATLALLAAQRVQRQPDVVLAWEPVLSGARYLEALRRHHAQALRTTYSILPQDIELHPVGEAMGFEMSETLRRQLAALDAVALQSTGGLERLVVTATGEMAEAAQVGRTAAQGSTRQLAFDHDFEWNSEEAIYTAPLVPPEALRMLIEQIEGLA